MNGIYSLLALKVLVGTNLLGYAYRRYAGMTERDTQENQKYKEMKEMNKDEEVRKKRRPLSFLMTLLLLSYFPFFLAKEKKRTNSINIDRILCGGLTFILLAVQQKTEGIFE